MLSKIYKTLSISALILLPTILFAQGGSSGDYLGGTSGILVGVRAIVSGILIPLVFSLALLYFFWGVAKYIRDTGDKDEGRAIMWRGIIALFVISTVWGLVYFLRDEFDLDDNSTIDIPTIGNPGVFR